jgi:hypothetical protein
MNATSLLNERQSLLKKQMGSGREFFRTLTLKLTRKNILNVRNVGKKISVYRINMGMVTLFVIVVFMEMVFLYC